MSTMAQRRGSAGVIPGYTMPAGGGDWFDKLLGVAAGGYAMNQNRKWQEAQAQQQMLLAQVERDSAPANARMVEPAPVTATGAPVAPAQWIAGIPNQTVILSGVGLMFAAMMLK